MEQTKEQITATLLYADVFEYPLTEQQLWDYLIAYPGGISTQSVFRDTVSKYQKDFYSEKGYYSLAENSKKIRLRFTRLRESKKKLIIAKKAIAILSLIPTIQCIGISGGLSVNNADTQDDIDLFIVTKHNTVWITRFYCLLLLQLIGRRRKPEQQNAKDSICINMILDEKMLKINKKKQNVFIAHEVAQLLPFFDRDGIYNRFFRVNDWIHTFLPNVKPRNEYISAEATRNVLQNVSAYILKQCNYGVWIIQYQYMKNRITNERVSYHEASFHPTNYQDKVYHLFRKKLILYKPLFSKKYMRFLQECFSEVPLKKESYKNAYSQSKPQYKYRINVSA